MRTEASEPDQHATATTADDLLREAREEARHGSQQRAWEACLQAAGLGRALGDATIVARAAIGIPGPSVTPSTHTATRQALCLEAIALLGDSAPDLRALVEAKLEAVSSAWSASAGAAAAPVDEEEAQRRFLNLQAAHTRAQGPAGVGDRLAVAGELVGLGVAAADEEILAWGRLWRLDALGQLGLRIEWNAELVDLTAAVDLLGSPTWRWRLAVIYAALALQEDRLDDVPELIATARELADAAGVEDGRLLDLILRSACAERTGEGLEGVEAEVRQALTGMPFLAQGWRAKLLARIVRTEEAVGIWRSLAPHLDDLPANAVEWLLAHVGHAGLAALARDRDRAVQLRRLLEPFGHHQVAPTAVSPHGGPVALGLGRLCVLLDDDDSAELWFREAAARADAVVAPWYAAQAADELARLNRTLGPLSRREGQVARLVARGLTNREVADRLVLSERTVEQHVRSILRKLDVPNRAGIASWVAGRG